MNLRALEILRRPGAQVLAFIALTTLPKVALALFEDHDSIEAYHRLYAQHLAAGYYDHPGMIGWLIHLSTSLFGDSLLAVRLPTIIGSGFAIGFAFLAGRRMYGESTGRLAAFLVGLVPMTARFAMEATPDGPLLCFWMGAIWSLAHALQGAGSRPGTSPFGSTMGWWLLAGLFTGAAMDSKYSAIFLPAGLLLYLMLSREHRLWLLRVEPYLAAFAALACFWPTVAWNAEHQWQSFAYQGGERIKAAREFTLNHFGLFLRRQVTMVTPFVLAWVVVGAALTAARWRARSWADRFNACLGLPVLLLFTGLSVFRSVRAHWPIVGYLSLFLLSASIVDRGGKWGKRLHYGTLSLLLGAGIAWPIAWAAAPAERVKTWDRLATTVRGLRPDFVIAADYHDAADLAWSLHPMTVSDLSPLGLGGKSFPAWWRPDAFVGKDAVLVTEKSYDSAEVSELKRHFDAVEDPVEVRVHPLGTKAKTYLFWKARGYRPPLWMRVKPLPPARP